MDIENEQTNDKGVERERDADTKIEKETKREGNTKREDAIETENAKGKLSSANENAKRKQL